VSECKIDRSLLSLDRSLGLSEERSNQTSFVSSLFFSLDILLNNELNTIDPKLLALLQYSDNYISSRQQFQYFQQCSLSPKLIIANDSKSALLYNHEYFSRSINHDEGWK